MKSSCYAYLLIFLVFVGNVFSQKVVCGHDRMTSIQKENTSNYDDLLHQNNLNIKAYIAEHYGGNAQSRPSSTVYTIPVVFHVIHPTGQAYGTGSNLSYLQLQSQIDALNAAFGKTYPTYNGQSHPSYAQNTGIRFCLARTPSPLTATFYAGPGGTEYGVRRYADNTVSNHQMGNAGMSALTGLTHPNGTYFPFANYLNIWVVSNIASGSAGITMGYATPPPASAAFDGIVMRADVTGDNSPGNNFSLNYGLTQGKIMVHEAGHYLNLQHIFNGACTGANAAGAPTDACDLNGDYICDTEPCATQNILCTQPIPNTCVANYNAGTTNMDMIESYLSYADDDCMNTFTYNQSQRMWAALNMARFNLWQLTNLGNTGVSGPNGCNPATLFTNITVGGNCTNLPISVASPTAGNSAISWTWTATGSSVPTANTSSLSIVYNTPGLKTIKLSISDGTVTLLDSVVISVTNCSLDPNKKNRSNWLFGDFASMSFATGQPVANNVAIANNTIKCFENAVSMSDSLGNLLFYSNGRNLWRSNHTQVNTTPLFGWDNSLVVIGGPAGSSVGGFMSFPFPKQTNKHFIICVPPFEAKGQPNIGQYAKINYVVYDAVSQTATPFQSLTSPLINYVSAYPNFGLSENLNVIPHCNGVDYWVVARGTNPAGTGFYFYSFLVNQNGLNASTTPVLSGLYPLSQIAQYCDMKSNTAGNKMICKGQNRNIGYIWDFDQSSGVVSNPVALPSTGNGTMNLGTGIIFSPNNQYIYSAVGVNSTIKIDMINVSTNTIVKTLSAANGSFSDFYFEMGPDNIIYMPGNSNATGSALAQITNPDSAPNSTLSTYVNFSAIPNGKPNSSSILNFMEAVKPAETSPLIAPVPVSCSTYSFALNPCWKVYNATWNFGDGAVSTASNVTHTYAASGTYVITLSLSYNGVSIPAYTTSINVFSAGNVSIAGPTVICVGSTYLNNYNVQQFPNATYSWSATNATINVPSNASNASAAGGNAGVATLSVQVSNGGCVAIATKTVNIVDLQVSFASTATTACTGQNINLNASPAGGTYSGTTASGVFNSSNTGTFNVSYAYNNSGCYKTISKTITVFKCTGAGENDMQAWETNLYPNPNNGLLFINSNLDILYYEIINPLGQLIMKDGYGAGINTSGLSNGIYFISVKNERGDKVKLKFVKE